MVLTPTLVGDGNKLSPIDYMVWRDQVNVLDQNRIFKLLSRGPRLEGYLAQLGKATHLDFASWGGFAQNYADRHIPFEDPSCTPHWNALTPDSLFIPTFASAAAGPYLPGAALKGALRTAYVFSRVKPAAIRELAEKLAGDKPPRRAAEQLEHQAAGQGGSDRMRAVSVSDSVATKREQYKIYMCRTSSLASRGTDQFSLAWKQTEFAEMAVPGTIFEGSWRESAFLNREEVRQSLHWSKPVNHRLLFDAANQHAAKQLEIHASYAKLAGMADLEATVAALQNRLEAARTAGSCLMALGWGAGFLSKSVAIGADEADHRKVLGSLPMYQKAIRTGLPFPKTRCVVFMGNRPAALPGWVELRVD
jgi:CRISPR-associated protein Csm5